MLQQHKAIGTVEECRLAVKKYDYDMNTSCGKILPAIYPYRKCDKCHEKETSMRMIEQFVEENLYDDFIFF